MIDNLVGKLSAMGQPARTNSAFHPSGFGKMSSNAGDHMEYRGCRPLNGRLELRTAVWLHVQARVREHGHRLWPRLNALLWRCISGIYLRLFFILVMPVCRLETQQAFSEQ